jgi:hypothetical protein
MKKIMLGIPTWGTQSPDFWQPAIMQAANLYRFGIELVDVAVARSMSTDNNRNEIVKQFLASDAEWMAWQDTDNSQPMVWIPRLLEGERPLSGGIYFRRDLGRPTPIAYLRGEGGRYSTIKGYVPGEIIPVDAGGMNATLMHRSVFEEIEKNYTQFLTPWGARFTVHDEDIDGYVSPTDIADDDNRVVNGQLRIRLRPMPYTKEKDVFPWFSQEHNRTEDMPFYEMAQRVGFQMWIDTSIECKHYADVGVDGSHYREWIREQIKNGEWEE